VKEAGGAAECRPVGVKLGGNIEKALVKRFDVKG